MQDVEHHDHDSDIGMLQAFPAYSVMMQASAYALLPEIFMSR